MINILSYKNKIFFIIIIFFAIVNKRYREIEIDNFKLNKNFAINNRKRIKNQSLITITSF